jgi:hypothetical protein
VERDEFLAQRRSSKLWLAIALTLTMATACPRDGRALAPARFYWDTLSNSNAFPLIVQSINGNTNPFDPAHVVTPGADFDATLAFAGYAHTFSLFDRSAMAAILVPVGRISGDVTVAGNTFNQSADGFGDPMLEFDFNLIGPKAQKNIPDAMRYEPGFSVDLLFDLAFPVGEYDDDQSLNIGQNRWYGRVGCRSSGNSAPGCRAVARPWNCCPRSGSSGRTTTSSGRHWKPIRCSSSTRT